jgi:pimeloyl-ACP methyl ester carboxylesterase
VGIRTAIYYLVLILVGLGVMKVLVVLLEPRLTFIPARHIPATPGSVGIKFEEIRFPSEDGTLLSAWYIPHDNPTATVLFFHGNGGNLSVGHLGFLLDLHKHGYSVFGLDYRGFGRSEGNPSEQGIFMDSRSFAFQYWENLHQEADPPVLYYGFSIGGVMASCAAAAQQPHGLVLQSTFPDKSTFLRHHSPILRFLGLFSRYRLATIDFLDGLTCPVLVIHGDRDNVVAYRAGEILYQQLEMEKEFLKVPGAGHTDIPEVGGERYWQQLRDFVHSLDRSGGRSLDR